jgi:hypothetical protein
MVIMPKPLTLKKRLYLKRASWSVWIKEFNKIHNPAMFTSVGCVEVNVNEKKNSNTKKSKKPNR